MRYHEEQRFSGGWRWFWAAVILGPGAIAAVVLLVIGATTGIDFTMPFLIVVAVEVAMLALLILILQAPVIVDVTDDGVHIRVPPFVKEHIPAAELVSVEEVASGLFRRHGAGVGKRFADRRARYTVGNDAGVVIERANGWRIVIGSPGPAEFAAAIRSLLRPAKVNRYRV